MHAVSPHVSVLLVMMRAVLFRYFDIGVMSSARKPPNTTFVSENSRPVMDVGEN